MMYKVDYKYYLINEASKKKIKLYYRKIVNEIIKYYKQYLKKDILSIYIRGSVPLGRAKKIFQILI